VFDGVSVDAPRSGITTSHAAPARTQNPRFDGCHLEHEVFGPMRILRN
jgi:hypothetical protein